MSLEAEDNILEKGMQRDTNCAVILNIVQKGGEAVKPMFKKKLQIRAGLLAKNWDKIALKLAYKIL